MSEPISIGQWVAERHLGDRTPAADADGVEPENTRQFTVEQTRAFHRERAVAQFDNRLGRAFRRFRDARADHPTVLAWVKRYLAVPDSGESLVLLGTTGTGKTYQSVGAVRLIAESGRRPLNWRAVGEADLYWAMRGREGAEAEDVFRTYADADLLIFDDIGSAKASAWTEEVTYRLINHRYAGMLPTLITGNMRLDDLRERLGDRSASRLSQIGLIVPFDGPDRRRDAR